MIALGRDQNRKELLTLTKNGKQEIPVASFNQYQFKIQDCFRKKYSFNYFDFLTTSDDRKILIKFFEEMKEKSPEKHE